MKKQILKALTMLVIIMTMALITAVVSANAQTRGRSLEANVPFDFIVGDQTMAAGQYSISQITQQADDIAVRSAASSANAIRLTNGVEADETPKQSKLVFHQYGDKFYLAQIWTVANREGRELLKSRSEKTLERELSASQGLAANAKQETVIVIASLQ
jgi:hypothetical protein